MYKPEKVWSHQTLLRLIFLFCLIYFTGKSLELNYLENGTSSQFKIYSTVQLICFDFVCWPKTEQGFNQHDSTLSRHGLVVSQWPFAEAIWGGSHDWWKFICSVWNILFPLFSRPEQPACNAGVRGQTRNVSLDIGINQLWRLEKFDGTDLTLMETARLSLLTKPVTDSFNRPRASKYTGNITQA